MKENREERFSAPPLTTVETAQFFYPDYFISQVWNKEKKIVTPGGVGSHWS